jgi:hypothetical protein
MADIRTGVCMALDDDDDGNSLFHLPSGDEVHPELNHILFKFLEPI